MKETQGTMTGINPSRHIPSDAELFFKKLEGAKCALEKEGVVVTMQALGLKSGIPKTKIYNFLAGYPIYKRNLKIVPEKRGPKKKHNA